MCLAKVSDWLTGISELGQQRSSSGKGSVCISCTKSVG